VQADDGGEKKELKGRNAKKREAGGVVYHVEYGEKCIQGRHYEGPKWVFEHKGEKSSEVS